MKRVIYCFVFVYPSNEDSCLRELTSVGGVRVLKRRDPLPPSSHRPSAPVWDAVDLQLAIEPERWPEVEVVLDKYAASQRKRELGESRLFREECVFTKKELDTAEMLAIRVNRSPLDYMGIHEGMNYDWTVKPTDDNPAPWCWQKTPRLMMKKDMPKPQVGLHSTIPLEILVHKRLLDAVKGLKYKHAKLGPVLASGEHSDWFQLMTDRVMPPYHEATTGIRTYTQEYAPAGSPRTVVRNTDEGYWPAYRRAELVERYGTLPPITFTWELEGWWGITIGPPPKPDPRDLSHQSAPPQPRLIVDQQTRREFMAAGVTRLEYVPLSWMD